MLQSCGEGAGNVIVMVGHTKGGVGKTAIALQLALSRALDGRDVLLIDADRQGSAQEAITMRAEAGRTPALACVHFEDGRALRAQMAALAARHDDTVVDVGGRDSMALRVALTRADVLLAPVVPRAVDVWALRDLAELIEQAQETRESEGLPPLRTYAALSMADPGSNQDNIDTVAALAHYPQLTVLEAPVRRRKAIANAMAQGLSVRETQAGDPKAVAEITALCGQLFERLETVE
jgi:chromosome partitioning protein